MWSPLVCHKLLSQVVTKWGLVRDLNQVQASEHVRFEVVWVSTCAHISECLEAMLEVILPGLGRRFLLG